MKEGIAIIGSGPGGTGFISELVSQSNDLKIRAILARNTVHIFDEAVLFGAGLPYNQMMTDAEHLLNIQTVSGSIPQDLAGEIPDPESLFKWMQSNKDLIENKFLTIFEDRFKEKFEKRFGQKFQSEKYSEYREISGFVELEEHYVKLWNSFKNRYLNFEKAKDFHPRILYGMFSIYNFRRDLETLAERGIKVVLHTKSTVSSVDGDTNLFFIENGEEKSKRFAKIFIATGMMDNQKENEEDSPVITKLWPIKEVKDRLAKLIDEAKEFGKSTVKIAIKGTGLAAIDIVKTIFRDGLFECDETGELVFTPHEEDAVKVVVDMISRTGILPKVRGSWDETPESAAKYGNMAEFNKRIRELPRDEDGKLPLWFLISRVAEEMSEIYKAAGDVEAAASFQSFAHFAQESRNNNQIFERFLSYRNRDAFLELESDVLQALNEDGSPKDIIWQNIYNQLAGFSTLLNESDKTFFDGLMRWRQNYSTPMPAQSAKELVALHKAGVLDVKALGRDSRQEIDEKVVRIESHSDTKTYDLVINATGERLGVASIEGSNSPLYQSLEKIEAGQLSIISDNAHLTSELREKDLIISRRVGGIAGARRFGREAAKAMVSDLIVKQNTENIVLCATAAVVSQGIAGHTY